MIFRLLADLVLILHLLFVVLALFGGFLVAWRTGFAWVHVPAAVWAAVVELAGLPCPLTPLENMLRRAGAEAGYSGGFVEHYLHALLYPLGLAPRHQLALAAVVILTNAAVYTWVIARHRRAGR